MSRVFVCGLGAVSPAGWTVAAMREALAQGRTAARSTARTPWLGEAAPGASGSSSSTRLPFLAHPRLRRTSPITHYAAAAALEAVAGLRPNNERNRRAWRGRLPPVRLCPILLPVLR